MARFSSAPVNETHHDILKILRCCGNEEMKLKSQDKERYEFFKEYFSRDNRFACEGVQGLGRDAMVLRLIYTPIHEIHKKKLVPVLDGYPEKILVKISRPGKETTGSNERDILRRLRGAAHVVQKLDIFPDPIVELPDGTRISHLYLENLDTGPLATFIKRASSRGYGPGQLPNRLLWQLFLCMIRGFIALSWPPDGKETERETALSDTPPSGIGHNDLHTGNLLFGPFLCRRGDSEHAWIPILKLIDFGSAGPKKEEGEEGNYEGTAEQNNIYEIGTMMHCLIVVDEAAYFIWTGYNAGTYRFLDENGNLSQRSGLCFANEILPEEGETDPCPLADQNLRRLVAQCLAKDPNDRPSLATLERLAYRAVNEVKPEEHGAQAAAEEGEDIFELIWDLLFTASTGEPDLLYQ